MIFIAIILISATWKQQAAFFETLDTNQLLDQLYNVPLLDAVNDIMRDTSSSWNNPIEQPRNALQKRKMTKATSDVNTQASSSSSSKPLNIVLFYADDWRFDTLGAAGNPVVKTPVLDQLAKDGMLFRENCVTTSVCWISRATLHTGMYLARHKFETLGKGRKVNGTNRRWETPTNETIYALLKHHAGYHVGHAGKLGLWVSLDRKKNTDFFVNEDGWHYSERKGKLWHITEKNTHDAMIFLKARPRTKPFFLNVGYFATHAVDKNPLQYLPQNQSMSLYANDTIPIPLTVDAYGKMPYFFGQNNEGRTRWRWRFDEPTKHQSMMKNYYRMATEVDTSVGTLMKELERQGVLNDTLLIFTTDNGNFHAEHGLADKWYPHQESIKVPLIIKDPRMDPEFVGTINDDFTLNIDLAPTILKAAGIEPLSTMMGRDMSELYTTTLNGVDEGKYLHDRKRHYLEKPRGLDYHTGTNDEWRTEFFYHHPMHTNENFIPASEALVRKNYKYMYWPNFDYEELFDLQSDPGEVNDLLQQRKGQSGEEWNIDQQDHVTPQVKTIYKEMRARFQELKEMAHRDEEAIIL